MFGWQKMVFEKQLAFFRSYGLNRKIMFLTGVIELFGAITIWFQASIWGVIGAGAILFTSTGAIFCHLRFDSWKDGVPAMMTFTLSALVIISGRAHIFSLMGAM